MSDGDELIGAHAFIARMHRSNARARGAPMSAAVDLRFGHATGMAGGTETHEAVQSWLQTNELRRDLHPYALCMITKLSLVRAANRWTIANVEIEPEVVHPALGVRTRLDFAATLNGAPCVGELKTAASLIDFERLPYDQWHRSLGAALCAARDAELRHALTLSDTQHLSIRAGQPHDGACTPCTAALLQLVVGAAAYAHTRNVPFEDIVGLLVVAGEPARPSGMLFRLHMRHYAGVLRVLHTLAKRAPRRKHGHPTRRAHAKTRRRQ